MQLEMIALEPQSDERPTPILFVHGMWCAAWCWNEHFMPYFAERGYTCFAPSLRGHGSSEGRERLLWTSLADYVADIDQAVEEIGMAPILIGHSMGGVIVQKALENIRSSAAILLASGPPKGLLAATLRTARRYPAVTAQAVLRLDLRHIISTRDRFRESLFSDRLSDDKLGEYHERMQAESFRAYLDMIGFDLPQPQKVRTPMLVLGAIEDRMIAQSEVIATAMAYHTSAEFFPAIGHAMMLDVGWETVAERMIAWLGTKGC